MDPFQTFSELLDALLPAQTPAAAETAADDDDQARSEPPAEPQAPPPILQSFDIQGIASYIEEKNVSKVVCMIGAGTSVSAGIPDFRTPGTGLFSNLEKYNLPYPEAVFDIGFFPRNPEPFYKLAKELRPENFKPTDAHFFIKLLHDKGLLLRCYSQNIDSLERAAGLPADKLVAAHGNFDAASCIDCEKPYSIEDFYKAVDDDKILRCHECSALIKPDIVFYGEGLPDRFGDLCNDDLGEADLLIIMGTSLTVYPFAALRDMVADDTPRLLINREVVGVGSLRGQGLWFGEGNRRDAKFLGDCDNGARELARLLGWSADLQALVDGRDVQDPEEE